MTFTFCYQNVVTLKFFNIQFGDLEFLIDIFKSVELIMNIDIDE